MKDKYIGPFSLLALKGKWNSLLGQHLEVSWGGQDRFSGNLKEEQNTVYGC